MKTPHGVIDQSHLGRKNDYLYRVSFKGMIRNGRGEVLVVKESGRDWWDLPGGGMDHDESVQVALAREMHEEIGLVGPFTYRPIAVEDPGFLEHANLWQIRIIFEVKPESMNFTLGKDADEFRFINPEELRLSKHFAERGVHSYSQLLS